MITCDLANGIKSPEARWLQVEDRRSLTLVIVFSFLETNSILGCAVGATDISDTTLRLTSMREQLSLQST